MMNRNSFITIGIWIAIIVLIFSVIRQGYRIKELGEIIDIHYQVISTQNTTDSLLIQKYTDHIQTYHHQ